MRALLALVLLGGCFKPSPGEGFACGPDRWCPDPLSCGVDNICRSKEPDPGGDGGPGDEGLPGGPANIAFVTSMTYTPQQLAGVAGADAICTGLGAGIGKPGRYVAWLSTVAAPAVQRLGNASGWVRTDGKPFAASKQDLLAGKILYPLRRDENNNEVLGPVLTGTLPDGSSSENCVEFTSTSGTELALLGFTDGSTTIWTNGSEGPCNGSYYIYCLQADLSNPVAAPPSSNPKMFLSTTYTPAGGVPTADTRCQNDAAQHGIPGSFIALLSTTAAAATSRLTLSGVPWVRVDNVEVTSDFATYDGTPSVTADGSHVLQLSVFAGATAPFVKSQSGTESCNDWGNNGTSALTGVSARGLPGETFGGGSSPCAQQRVYCFEKR
jgi:hypothetical protein